MSFVRSVRQRLRTSFAAVGLFGWLNDSLRLFGRVAGCGDGFLAQIKHYNSRNIREEKIHDSTHTETIRRLEAQFETCRAELYQKMSLDWMLYREAGLIMQTQARRTLGIHIQLPWRR